MGKPENLARQRKAPYTFQEPTDTEDARRRRGLMTEVIQKIESQRANPSCRERVRLSSEADELWQKQARRAISLRQLEIRFLNEWIRQRVQEEQKEVSHVKRRALGKMIALIERALATGLQLTPEEEEVLKDLRYRTNRYEQIDPDSKG